MFIPVAGCTYSSNISDLAIKIMSVKESEDRQYIRIQTIITNKRNGIFYDMGTYDVALVGIQHWIKI